ncbi:MAG: P27 family phage terminase small subunit [Bacillus sp. (in: firmicutes)]
MKYKDIAEKYDVSMNTVKSWKKRHNWNRKADEDEKKVAEKKKKAAPKNKVAVPKIRKLIELDLKRQLADKGATHHHYLDLVSDYLSMWDIKNMLIEDIRERGVVVRWSNGTQEGHKKNDSISELNKTNAQMLKIISELGLKATELSKDDDGYEDV